MHARVGHIFEGQRDAHFTLRQGRDAMAQRIAVEEHQSAGRNLASPGSTVARLLTRVQLVVEAAGRVVDQAQQQV
jgi:hypothetical protein